MSQETITYEQPLNEPIRLCLRLEHIFNELHEHLKNHSTFGSRAAMIALLKVVDVTDRPDLKSKISVTLTQQASSLAQLKQFPQVDSEKLQTILDRLDELIDIIHGIRNKKLGENLRSNPFLKQVRMQLSNPAGPCDFRTPAFALWLQKTDEQRLTDLQKWTKEFEQLESMVRIILSLIRDSSPPQQVSTNNDFFQQSLDPSLPCQMIRITVPTEFNAYPEVSVGKHRLSIRFKALDIEDSGVFTKLPEIPFSLSYCRI